ncbi:TPA: hypothetical protein DEP94_01515 [Candidatus Nomurabacteria bacterium]|nr:hypothetical protein [Candidatus Nomurabacteria bacterium]
MKTKIFATLSLLIIIPNISYAAATDLNFGSLITLADTLATGVVKSLGFLAFTLAVVVFLWGMVNFIWSARNGDAGKGVENGKQFMVWGLITLFVMFSVWGIIIFVQDVLDIKGNTSITIPNIELLGSSPTQSNAPASQNNRCPNGKDSACTITTSTGDVSGFCNDLNQCVTGRTAGGSGVTTACPNGPRFPCTLVTSTGNVDGVCNGLGQCERKDVTKLNCTPPEVSNGIKCITPDAFCLAYKKDAECPTKDSSGKDVIGKCDAYGSCIVTNL